jgi:hypothetical protein
MLLAAIVLTLMNFCGCFGHEKFHFFWFRPNINKFNYLDFHFYCPKVLLPREKQCTSYVVGFEFQIYIRHTIKVYNFLPTPNIKGEQKMLLKIK